MILRIKENDTILEGILSMYTSVYKDGEKLPRVQEINTDGKVAKVFESFKENGEENVHVTTYDYLVLDIPSDENKETITKNADWPKLKAHFKEVNVWRDLKESYHD